MRAARPEPERDRRGVQQHPVAEPHLAAERRIGDRASGRGPGLVVDAHRELDRAGALLREALDHSPPKPDHARIIIGACTRWNG